MTLSAYLAIGSSNLGGSIHSGRGGIGALLSRRIVGGGRAEEEVGELGSGC